MKVKVEVGSPAGAREDGWCEPTSAPAINLWAKIRHVSLLNEYLRQKDRFEYRVNSCS